MSATIAPNFRHITSGEFMPASCSRIRNRNLRAARPAIESLEPRAFLSGGGTANLLVTVPGPIPASAIAGAKVNDRIKVNIANEGAGKFSGRTTVTLYASSDGTFSDADVQLGGTTTGITIPAGTNKSVSIKVSKFPLALNGSYFVLANVITPAQTVEGVSKSAVDVSPANVDLSDALVSVPSVAHLGGKISVTLDVSNHGNEIATGTLDTLFELSSNSAGSNPFQVANVGAHIKLKPGASAKLHLNVPVALGSPSGNQFIVAVVDPSDRFNDSNLANNVAISAAPVTFK
jgi:CARDB protein